MMKILELNQKPEKIVSVMTLPISKAESQPNLIMNIAPEPQNLDLFGLEGNVEQSGQDEDCSATQVLSQIELRKSSFKAISHTNM